MASIQEMKAQLARIAKDIEDNAKRVEGMNRPLSTARSQVSQTLQGSSRGVDTNVNGAINRAEQSVGEARKSLDNAAKALLDYAGQL